MKKPLLARASALARACKVVEERVSRGFLGTDASLAMDHCVDNGNPEISPSTPQVSCRAIFSGEKGWVDNS